MYNKHGRKKTVLKHPQNIQQLRQVHPFPKASYESVRPAAMLEKAEPPALSRTTEPAFQGSLGQAKAKDHRCIHDLEIKPWKST